MNSAINRTARLLTCGLVLASTFSGAWHWHPFDGHGEFHVHGPEAHCASHCHASAPEALGDAVVPGETPRHEDGECSICRMLSHVWRLEAVGPAPSIEWRVQLVREFATAFCAVAPLRTLGPRGPPLEG